MEAFRLGGIGSVVVEGCGYIEEELCSDQEVPERFARTALAAIAFEQRREQCKHYLFADIARIQLRQPIAARASAQIEVVQAGRATGQRHLGQVGARAAVGAAGEAQGDRYCGAVVPLYQRLK